MTKESLHPSTLIGIKSLAKDLKLEKKIKHVEALNQAAKIAGFSNFSHAQNQLRSPILKYSVFLTAYWWDRDAKKTGRETLVLLLSEEWGNLISPRQLRNARALFAFRSEGPDHLVRQNTMNSQSSARRAICAAARTLQFIDVTRLRPSRTYDRALPKGLSTNTIPGSDHSSVWFYPETKQYLFADEPYEESVKEKQGKREAWASKHDFVIERPSWPGMYNPDGGSQLYLISDAKKGVSLTSVIEALKTIRIPIVEENWNGESAEISPRFVSPGKLKQKELAKKASINKPIKQVASQKPKQITPRTQIYRNYKMTIAGHTEVGRFLKEVLVMSHHRKGVYNRLNRVRCDLDGWAQREYNYEELPNEQFFELYYHETGLTFQRKISSEERERQVSNIQGARRILCEHYPDYRPLRPILSELDNAIKSMQTWI